MTIAPNPTVRRKQLGSLLRRLREQAGVSIDEAAEHLMCSSSKISRLETGHRGISPRDVRDLLDRYGITDPEQRQALMDIGRESKRRGWWRAYSDVISDEYSVLIGLETAAKSVYSYEASIVPGLFQTAEYAHAVTRSLNPGISDEEVERRVGVRATRQSVLERDDPLHMWVVLDEAVLRRPLGGEEAMRVQLRHLIQVAKPPHVTLQVMPFAAGGHAGMLGAFKILEFSDPDDQDVAYAETAAGETWVEKTDDVQRYRLMFDHLRALALGPGASAKLIAEVAKEL